MQILEMASRMELWHYIRCNAYVNHINVNTRLKHAILNANDRQLKKLLSTISYDLNISLDSLKAVMNGDTTPMNRLIEEMSLIVSSREDLIRFIQTLMYAQNVDEDLLLKHTHTKPGEISRIIRHDKVISNYTLTKLANTFSINPKIMYDCFDRVHISSVRPLRVPATGKKKHRLHLKGYIRCLCYLNGLTIAKLSKEIGFKGSYLMDIVLNGSEHQVLKAIEQLPFILHKPMKSFRAVMHGDIEPQKQVLININKHIKNRDDLYTFIYALVYMAGTTTKALAENMGRSQTYVSSTLQNGTGQALSEMFTKIAKLFDLPNHIFMVALARANVSSAYHSYLARMHFIVRYDHSPIDYVDTASKTSRKEQRINITADYHNVRNDIKNAKPRELTDSVRDMLADLGRYYGFDYKALIKDNLKNFSDTHKRTYIRQNGQYHAIMNNQDIPVLLKKLHVQLTKARSAFSLHEFQKTEYAPYVYVKGINLSHPIARDADIGLGKFCKGRHTFRAHFGVPDITQVNISPIPDKKLFAPVIWLRDVEVNGKKVADDVEINYTRGFAKLGRLETGDLLSFTARVKPYLRGKYTKKQIKVIDYRIERPGQIKMIRRKHRRTPSPVPDPKYKKSALVAYAMEHNSSAGYDLTLLNYKFIRNCKIQYRHWKESLKKNDKH